MFKFLGLLLLEFKVIWNVFDIEMDVLLILVMIFWSCCLFYLIVVIFDIVVFCCGVDFGLCFVICFNWGIIFFYMYFFCSWCKFVCFWLMFWGKWVDNLVFGSVVFVGCNFFNDLLYLMICYINWLGILIVVY